MRHSGRLMVLLLMVGFAFHVQAQDHSSLKKTLVADAKRFARPEDLRVLECLSRRMTLDVEEISLDLAVEQVSQFIDLDVLINDRALNDEAVSKESAVTLNLGEVTAWQALHFLLRPLNLVWIIRDGLLEITTATDAENQCVTRVHDVKKLCQLLTPITNETFLRNRRAKPGFPCMGAGQTAMVGPAMFSVPSETIIASANAQMSKADCGGVEQTATATKVIELLLAHIVCDFSSVRWQERDGDGGTVALGEGALIITQSFQGHLEIAGILQALEFLAEGHALGNVITAQKPGSPVDDEDKIFSLLAKPRTVQIDAGPLSAAFKKIAQEAGFLLWIDRKSLSEENKDFDAFGCSSRRFRELPLGICLRKILEQHELTFVVEQGVIVVTTRSNADQSVSVRFYDMGSSSKISGDEQLDGIKNILRGVSRTTLDDEWDEEFAFASFVSTRHFGVRQSQQANERIGHFVDDLVSKKLPFPIDPIYLELEFRTYTASDIATATDLVEALPALLQPHWNLSGSIRRAGASLIIKQPSIVHDRIDEILTKLEQSQSLRNPPATMPVDDPLDQPVVPQPMDDRVN